LFENRFKVVSIARHPLDVLISILHFIRYDQSTERWLEGNGEIPSALKEQPPTSAFVRYALSWGAENLLAITYQWWRDAATVRLRYEDLVRSPLAEFSKLAMSVDGQTDFGEAIAQNGITILQSRPNRHGWQASPGLYRSLIVYPDAQKYLEGTGRCLKCSDIRSSQIC